MKMTLKRLGSSLARAYGVVLNGAGFAGGLAAWLAASLIIAAVVARYVFNYAIVFSAEYATYLVCFIVFIGASYTMRIRRHVTVDLVVNRLPKRAQEWLAVIQLVLCVLFSIAFLAHGINLVKTAFEFGTVSITVMATPLAYLYLLIPIGFLLFAIESLIQLYGRIRRLSGHG